MAESGSCRSQRLDADFSPRSWNPFERQPTTQHSPEPPQTPFISHHPSASTRLAQFSHTFAHFLYRALVSSTQTNSATMAAPVPISEVKGNTRENRTATHSHIKGLGLRSDGRALETTPTGVPPGGFVGQAAAREVPGFLQHGSWTLLLTSMIGLRSCSRSCPC